MNSSGVSFTQPDENPFVLETKSKYSLGEGVSFSRPISSGATSTTEIVSRPLTASTTTSHPKKSGKKHKKKNIIKSRKLDPKYLDYKKSFADALQKAKAKPYTRAAAPIRVVNMMADLPLVMPAAAPVFSSSTLSVIPGTNRRLEQMGSPVKGEHLSLGRKWQIGDLPPQVDKVTR